MYVICHWQEDGVSSFAPNNTLTMPLSVPLSHFVSCPVEPATRVQGPHAPNSRKQNVSLKWIVKQTSFAPTTSQIYDWCTN